MEIAQLAALAAVVDEGSFDGAARRLHVTQSAVSQRIKALESSTGQVLVRRSRPVEVTAAGATYLRLARGVDALIAEAHQQADSDAERVTVPIAVNADSLETWVLPALASVDGVALDLHRADQSRTAELLRSGAVMAAVTDAATPVQGCRTTRLGVMRYRPVATPEFVERWLSGGVDAAALSRAPVVVFDRSDPLQDDFLRSHGATSPPRHHVPASGPFLRAVELGLGWGMIPDVQRPDAVRDLVELGDEVHDVELYWQRWAVRTEALDRLGEVVVEHARRVLA